MTYTFSPSTEPPSDSLTNLLALTLGNTFSSVKYEEQAKKFLNDAVFDLCRRLGMVRRTIACAYSSAGVVTQPSSAVYVHGPFFQVNEVWLADSSATGTGDQLIANYGVTKLEPLPFETAGDVGYGPSYYTVRNAYGYSAYAPAADITVVNPTAAGTVIVSGLVRPAVMSSTSAVTGLGPDFDWPVVAYAKSKLFMLEDDPEMAAQWQSEYMNAVQQAARPRHQDGPDITPGTWDGDSSPARGR